MKHEILILVYFTFQTKQVFPYNIPYHIHSTYTFIKITQMQNINYIDVSSQYSILSYYICK